MNYHNKKFRLISSTKNSETSEETVFIYSQEGNIITGEYSGGKILKGHLIGLVYEDGGLEMRYHQINTDKNFMTGICYSKPEMMPSGKLRLHEEWQWTSGSGDQSQGTSIVEEM